MTKQGAATRQRLERRFPRIQTPPPEHLVANGRAWVRVKAAKPWEPTGVGDALVGEFIGKTTRPGKNPGSTYGVITLRTAQGSLTISGTVISDLFQAQAIKEDQTVRVVYKGERVSAAQFTYKVYDLFLAADELTAVEAQQEDDT